MSGAPKEGGGGGGGGGGKKGAAGGAKVVDTVSITSADRDLIRGLMDMDTPTASPPAPLPDDGGEEIVTADGSGARAKHQEQSKR